VLRSMRLGRGHEAQHRKPAMLQGAANSGNLGPLGVEFMVLEFVLCYVIWARLKNTL
jgi:hypothetical protein